MFPAYLQNEKQTYCPTQIFLKVSRSGMKYATNTVRA